MKLITKYFTLETKPCPFCGGEAYTQTQDYGPTYLCCKKCGGGFEVGGHNDNYISQKMKTERIEFLIKKWNKRIKE
jgi:hypothetical protein